MKMLSNETLMKYNAYDVLDFTLHDIGGVGFLATFKELADNRITPVNSSSNRAFQAVAKRFPNVKVIIGIDDNKMASSFYAINVIESQCKEIEALVNARYDDSIEQVGKNTVTYFEFE